MTNKDDEILNEEENIEQNLDNDFSDLQDEIDELEQNEEVINKKTGDIDNDEIVKLKELLARTQADYQNFKFRSERDKLDTIFYIKFDIFKKILPRIDDLERMIKNTPEDLRAGALYDGIIAMQKAFIRDLETLGVKPFDSIGQEINPDKHEVMTQIPSENPGKIVDEFEKGYMLGDRVLRIAKVIVGI